MDTDPIAIVRMEWGLPHIGHIGRHIRQDNEIALSIWGQPYHLHLHRKIKSQKNDGAKEETEIIQAILEFIGHV